MPLPSSNYIGLFILLFAMTSCDTMANDTTLNSTPVNELISTSITYYDESLVESDAETTASGWAWYPFHWTWWLIVQAILAILGVIGNSIVVVVIYQRYLSIRSTDILIGALAISDLLTSVFLFPIPWAKRVPDTILGRLYCKLLYPSFFMWFCITAASYILVAICIERYVAIVFPLYFNRFNSKRKATIFVLVLWLFSFLQIFYALFTFIYDDSIGNCASTTKTELGRVAQAYYVISIRLFIPILMMFITQILIARSLHIQAKRFKGMVNSTKCDPNQSFHVVARNNIVKMMLIVVLVYIITWSPNQIAYLCFNLGYISPSYRGSSLHRILTLVGFLNSCVNPLIYATRNPEFRSAVRDLFLCSKQHDKAVFSPIVSNIKESKEIHRMESVHNA